MFSISRSAPLWGALVIFFLPVVAQQTSPPRLFVYHKLPADTAWAWQSIAIDPPLTLTRDAMGQAHLSVTLPNFVDHETPGEVKDGVNKVFTLAHAPLAVSLHLVYNGLDLSSPDDYALNGNTITITGNAPNSYDTIFAWYRY